jgi:limonene-1,2-epoxide hydrolase
MGDSTETPAEMVRSFLRLMEARDLDAASRYLAPQATITFPGGRAFTDLQQQVASSAQRFRRVTKTFDGCDVVGTTNGAVVYMFGTLAGEALDGTPFEGVRFIDRFVVEHGLIVDQRVWNDIAEVGVLPS